MNFEVKTLKRVTEGEITETVVRNEMEIFITLNKYNICQQREEGTCNKWWLLSQQKFPPSQ